MVYPMFFSPLGVAATHLDVHDVFRRRFSGGSTKALFGELRDVVQAACRWKWSLSGKWSSWGLSMAGWFSIVDLEWYRWPMSWGLSMVYCRWPIEIVDLPFLKMVIFQFVFVNVYQRVTDINGNYQWLVGGWPTPLKNDGVRQWGIWMEKENMFQTTNQMGISGS